MSDPVVPEPEFAELLRRAQAGDQKALGDLVSGHLPSLHALVRLNAGPLLRAYESHSDLVQTCCGRLIRDIAAFRGGDSRSFRAWLIQLVIHKLNDRRKYLRAQRRAPAAQAMPLSDHQQALLSKSYCAFSSPSQAAMLQETRERLEAAFDELNEEQQEVLSLFVYAGLGHDEIGLRTGRSAQASRALLARARARLALRMGEAKP
jgi:RNA polymerase sigma factor (sigma-70 family)